MPFPSAGDQRTVIALRSLTVVHSFTSLPTSTRPARPVNFVRLADNSGDAIAFSSRASVAHIPAPNENWIPLSANDFRRAVEANALEGGYVLPQDEGGNTAGERAVLAFVKQLTVAREDGTDADREAWRQWLLHDVTVPSHGREFSYSDLCFGLNCGDGPSFEDHPLNADLSTLTLVLRAPTPDTPTLSYLNRLAHLPASSVPGTNTTVSVVSGETGSSTWGGIFPNIDGANLFYGLAPRETEETNIALRKVRWIATAARVLVMRFWTLARNADSADVFVVLLGYALMHGTFAHLFIDMGKLGSSFWLREYRASI